MALKLHFIFWDYDEFYLKEWGDVAWMGGFSGQKLFHDFKDVVEIEILKNLKI